ncbi:cell polarity determinant GTPase MglA [Desulfosarcina ovata subsp. sediminis]|uniref:Cell polarity determinant GTPase MglA n=1 Tax=Desulfosarcina ovata subsp. sediminis TaxID=885957 RepID=A0A5K7ZI03_9BACT|nr:GTPase domain-containing protein [Desulfosarcina ovata]BBO79885.1 cell polarity determinant GTPase MglA [Desulfosarcina ovata subsp. sediminis]
MAFINTKTKEVQVKLVYVGPGRGGKTTNLEYIFSRIRHRIQSDMVSIKTQGDRTLFFDFLPFELGAIKGYNVKTQLYTVPGQVKYNATRKLVLKGVDGIVFVADSMVDRRENNIHSLENLKENLRFYDIDICDFPVILQYNKRDLGAQGVPILDLETMEQDLNAELKAPSFTASAVTGENVIATVKRAISTTMVAIREKLL